MKSTIFALAFFSLTLPANALDGTPSPANVAPAVGKIAPLGHIPNSEYWHNPNLPMQLQRQAQATPGGTPGVDPLIETWKLNLEKSTFTGRVPPKSWTATWAVDGEKLAVTIESVEAKGQPLKFIFKHIYDGQPHPVIGSPDNESNIYHRIGNSINGTFFKDGKVVGLTQLQLVPAKLLR
jgi:hypothetical protein